MSVIPEFLKLKQENHKFEACLSSIARLPQKTKQSKQTKPKSDWLTDDQKWEEFQVIFSKFCRQGQNKTIMQIMQNHDSGSSWWNVRLSWQFHNGIAPPFLLLLESLLLLGATYFSGSQLLPFSFWTLEGHICFYQRNLPNISVYWITLSFLLDK